MPVDVTEQKTPDELQREFKERYQALLGENQQLAKKIKDNEQTALKLLGAIETLEYLNPSEETPEVVEEAPADA
jgi:hypothetical protein|tara:strand:- start:29 stop:250 length:222 start_codon:yes stop_codon:yes gene_type:complete